MSTTLPASEQRPLAVEPVSPEASRPDAPPPAAAAEKDVDVSWWERALADAERAEKNWRARGREIVQIYRGDLPITRPRAGKQAAVALGQQGQSSVFNILYANTEVMLPAVYAKPPQPVVRSRFVKKSAMPPLPMGPPPGMMQGPQGPTPPGMPPIGSPAPPGAPEGPPPGMGGPPPGMPPGMPPPGMPPEAAMSAAAAMGGAPPGGMGPPMQGPAPPPPPGPYAAAPGMMPPPPPPQAPVGPGTVPTPAPMPPGLPPQQDIDTAAAVMEKALEIVLSDEASNEAAKAAVMDLLLPGRGTCRVRWQPVIEKQPLSDPMNPQPLMNPETGEPVTRDVKVWETVNDEYVFWEDLLIDPVRQHNDVGWIAFRHLFDEKALLAEFGDSEALSKYSKDGRINELLKWTEESAAKSPVGGGSPPRSASKLDAVIRKAMIWEIWVKSSREVIWLCRDCGGLPLRVDPDALSLPGFFPIPKPITAVTTTDTMIPKAYYDLYSHLAADIDATSRRISDLTDKIKIRGGYNAANKDIAALLTADDGKMLPVDGVDLISGGLQNHIWIVPILEWVNALKELYASREQQKLAIYEIMGISDIMRGSTNPNETATAQRIKGTMGVGRVGGVKTAVANFVRDLMRLKADIIAKNFDAETLTKMTGEEVTPVVLEILRDDFARVCSIDIETDSTVEVDETVEKEANAQVMQVIGGVMMSAQGLIQTGILPPPMIIQMSLEMIKMLLHPVRHSRGVVEMIDDFQEQLGAYMQQDPTGALMRPPPPPPPPGKAPTPAGPGGGGQSKPNGAGPPPGPPMLPPGGGPPAGPPPPM